MASAADLAAEPSELSDRTQLQTDRTVRLPGGLLDALKEVAVIIGEQPPQSEVLKLLFVALRLQSEDRWGSVEVTRQQQLGLWVLRAEHFNETFETCRSEVVVPMDAQDAISMERHEAVCAAFGVDSIFYALVDGAGDVVLYALQPAPLQAPPGQRPLSEPAFVPPQVLVPSASAKDNANNGEPSAGCCQGGRRKGRKQEGVRHGGKEKKLQGEQTCGSGGPKKKQRADEK